MNSIVAALSPSFTSLDILDKEPTGNAQLDPSVGGREEDLSIAG